MKVQYKERIYKAFDRVKRGEWNSVRKMEMFAISGLAIASFYCIS